MARLLLTDEEIESINNGAMMSEEQASVIDFQRRQVAIWEKNGLPAPGTMAALNYNQFKEALDRIKVLTPTPSVPFVPEPTLEEQEKVLQFFQYAHLPEHLQDASAPFCLLAFSVVANLPKNPERDKALDRLLEAKDAAVRALLYKE